MLFNAFPFLFPPLLVAGMRELFRKITKASVVLCCACCVVGVVSCFVTSVIKAKEKLELEIGAKYQMVLSLFVSSKNH